MQTVPVLPACITKLTRNHLRLSLRVTVLVEYRKRISLFCPRQTRREKASQPIFGLRDMTTHKNGSVYPSPELAQNYLPGREKKAVFLSKKAFLVSCAPKKDIRHICRFPLAFNEKTRIFSCSSAFFEFAQKRYQMTSLFLLRSRIWLSVKTDCPPRKRAFAKLILVTNPQ